MSFRKDMKINAIGTLFTSVLRVATVSTIATQIGADKFGVFIVSAIYVEVLIGLLLFGIPAILTRYISYINCSFNKRQFFSYIYNRCLILLPTIGVFSLFIAAFVIKLDAIDVVLFGLWSILTASGALAVAYHHGRMEFTQASLASAGGAGVTLSIVVFSGTTLDLTTVFGAMALGSCAQLIPALLSRQSPYQNSVAQSAMPSARRLTAFGGNLAIGSLSALILWNRGEVIALELVLSNEQIGVYGAVVTITGMVWRASALIQGPATPHLSKLIAQKDPQDINEFCINITKKAMFMSVSTSLFIIFFSSEIVSFIFGPQFKDAEDLLIWVAPATALAGMGVINQLIVFETNGRFVLIIHTISIIMLSILIATIVKNYDIVGAIVSRIFILYFITISALAWLFKLEYFYLLKSLAVLVVSLVILLFSALISVSFDLLIFHRFLIFVALSLFLSKLLVFGFPKKVR